MSVSNHPEGQVVDTAGMQEFSEDDRCLMALLSWGNDTAECAERLQVSERTVKNYVQKLCVTLGAKNRTQLVAIAIRRGIIK